MTFIQYIAIRAILDVEGESNLDNKALSKVISILMGSANIIYDMSAKRKN